MQVNKSHKLLNKINTIFHSILEDTASVSALEHELLKSYVVQFYDAIIAPEGDPVTNGQSVQTSKIQSSEPSGQSLVETASPVAETPVRQITPESSTVGKEVRSKSETVRSEDSIEADRAPTEEITNVLAGFFNEMDQLQSTTHIGERMVSDLKKCIGLNDKLLFANKLFGGDQSELIHTLDQLNSIEDIDTIKSRLNVLATKYDWLEEDKKKPVAEFIRLIIRKHSTPV